MSAGLLVIGNTCTFRGPHTSNPKRFLLAERALRTDVAFPVKVFGYSRRICRGRQFAMDALFFAISNILAIFTIEKAVYEHGGSSECSKRPVLLARAMRGTLHLGHLVAAEAALSPDVCILRALDLRISQQPKRNTRVLELCLL